MAVANIISIFQGMFAYLQGSDSSRSVQPPIQAAEWTQFGRKYTCANHVLDTAAGAASEDALLTATPNYASGIKVFGVYILPGAALTANGTNFATLQLGTRPQAGGGSQTTTGFTALTTAAVSWVASSQISIGAVATAGVAVAQNLVLTCAITKAASGVVVPQFTYMVEWAEA